MTQSDSAPVPQIRPSRPWSVLWFVLMLVFFVMWRMAKESQDSMSPPDPLRRHEWVGKGALRSYWITNGERAQDSIDADQDGIPETWISYNHLGKPIVTAYDADEDGLPERLEHHAPGGVAATAFDRDADGKFELIVQRNPDKSMAHWIDADGDGIYEVREAIDANGKLLFADEDRGAQGMVRRK